MTGTGPIQYINQTKTQRVHDITLQHFLLYNLTAQQLLAAIQALL